MVMPDLETDLAAARDMKSSNKQKRSVVNNKGRVDSQGSYFPKLI